MKQLLGVFLILPFFSNAQVSDFLIVKKKNKTVKYYYAGSQIEFVASNGAYRDALINEIKNDSLYLQEFMVVRRPTTLGTFFLDTVGSFRYVYHYKQIHSFGPKKQNNFNWSGSGATLMGGGTLLTLASGVSYLVDKDKFSPGLLAGALGLTGIGYLINKTAAKEMIVGRKYKVLYMGTK